MTSISELHGLDQNDPWKPPRTAQQERQETLKKRWFDILKDIQVEDMPFVDPPDDESRVIGERSQWFWRITITDHRLGDLVRLLPALPSVCYVMRNNTAGCWMAMTSRRIAQRTVQRLCEFGVDGHIDPCNEAGDALE